MSIHLSARLQAVADLVPLGARIIDVGTDHAMLPVWLTQTERITHAWASDLRPGPLQSAKRLITDTDTSHHIRLRLTDGLHGFCSEDGDTIIIAGMGGETMVSILSAATWTKFDTLLILEPQSKQSLLRNWLIRNGYRISHESLVKDTGRIYPILVAQGGKSDEYSRLELHTGHLCHIIADPLFGEYLDLLISRTKTAAPYDAQARLLLQDLEQTKERITYDRTRDI